MMRDRGLVIKSLAVILLGLAAVTGLSRWSDLHRQDLSSASSQEEQLYLQAKTVKRLSLAFNGLAADWYWMRSLQYVGRKVIKYEETQPGQQGLNDLGALDLRLMPSLLRIATTLDPQFIAPYEYGAMILPTFNRGEAIALLQSGIAENPDAWRLYQHLGYVYWQGQEYTKASETYSAGAKLPGAPKWMAEMGARTAAEGGSRRAAREMYQHLYDESTDEKVKELLARRLMQVDSFEERDRIRIVLAQYVQQFGKCPASWRSVAANLQRAGLAINPATGEPLDPSGAPYVLISNKCDVDLRVDSRVPYK
jgi:tetratricopeptide (TPR) repeat protein